MELMKQYGLGKANLAMNSFVASQHPSESCGHNGLPLTPNSIGILGRSEILKSLSHPNLCTYTDFQRGQHERIVSVSEWTQSSVKDTVLEQPHEWIHIAKQILSALRYLDENDIVVLNLSASNIVFSGDKTVKLYNYGLSHMTDYGVLVSFPVFDVRSVAPEVLKKGLPKTTVAATDLQDDESEMDSISHILPARKSPYKSSCTVWTLGMVILAKLIGLKSEQDFWPSLQVSQVVRKVLSLVDCQDTLGRLSREFGCESVLKTLPDDILQFLSSSFLPAETRPSPGELLQTLQGSDLSSVRRTAMTFPCMELRCKDLELPKLTSIIDDENYDENVEEHAIDALTLCEIYYLWVLAGGDIMSELRRHGLMVSLPPVLTLPSIMLNEGHPLGLVKERCALYDPVVMILPMNQLLSCLADLTVEDAYPLLSDGKSHGNDDMANLPLVIKEKDVKYQFSRIATFRRLLQGYPFTRRSLWKEARIDTLPFYRKLIWASLLGIEHDVQAKYAAIDKETWTPTDRQIEVDIPRCHQYNSLLASAEGHRKFKRVLKAWVATNPQYVYWQGLDSLCAPFLYLNFNDEALAFACLQAFIPKYLLGMFKQDNAPVIQEYLAKFSHLQAFHDPELFNQMDGIGFIPDLYAIPWVLTMFAHVFPLQSIFHLWDKLLLGNESFPLCLALAILQQLRPRLLDAEFNDCILLFSDLPAIDIEECVNDSIRIFCATPKSLTYRKCGVVGKAAEQPQQPSSQCSDLTLSSLTVEMQKADIVPRISGEELLMLLGLRPMKDELESYFVRPQKAKAVAVDVRPKSEFQKVSITPINIPSQSAFDGEGRLQVSIDALESARQKKSKVVCIVGSGNDDEARIFAEKLLRQNYHRVCYLHGGIEIFRSLSGIFVVPDFN